MPKLSRHYHIGFSRLSKDQQQQQYQKCPPPHPPPQPSHNHQALLTLPPQATECPLHFSTLSLYDTKISRLLPLILQPLLQPSLSSSSKPSPILRLATAQPAIMDLALPPLVYCTTYRLGTTRRRLLDGHYFCSNQSHRRLSAHDDGI